MKVALLIFDGITVLDAIGPYEVLRSLPGAEMIFVGETSGLKRTGRAAAGLLNAERAIAEVPAADILVVPGGFGEEQVCARPAVLEWIRAIDKTTKWTTSVCTGALILGAAGLLRGLKATTHWAQLDQLKQYGAIPTRERVVEQGKIITAAGVASGIDMALRLAQKIVGDEMARAIQIGIEYDPQPPFDGSPWRAPVPLIDGLRQRLEHARAAYRKSVAE